MKRKTVKRKMKSNKKAKVATIAPEESWMAELNDMIVKLALKHDVICKHTGVQPAYYEVFKFAAYGIIYNDGIEAFSDLVEAIENEVAEDSDMEDL